VSYTYDVLCYTEIETRSVKLHIAAKINIANYAYLLSEHRYAFLIWFATML